MGHAARRRPLREADHPLRRPRAIDADPKRQRAKKQQSAQRIAGHPCNRDFANPQQPSGKPLNNARRQTPTARGKQERLDAQSFEWVRGHGEVSEGGWAGGMRPGARGFPLGRGEAGRATAGRPHFTLAREGRKAIARARRLAD